MTNPFATDEYEYAIPIDIGVQWDMGAPLPYLMQREGKAFLTFYLSEPDPDWNGTYVSIVEPASSAPANIGIIEWRGCRGAILGSPNDEAIEGHRLWARGLQEVEGYGAAEVKNSAWIAELERVNRVHPLHNPEKYKLLHHSILMFHDSTFECVAREYKVSRVTKPMREVLVELTEKLISSE